MPRVALPEKVEEQKFKTLNDAIIGIVKKKREDTICWRKKFRTDRVSKSWHQNCFWFERVM